jgi:2-dehydro-3-deoxyphosphogalactonate aldolase
MNRNIIAILRGVTPDEAVPITQCLIRKGITKIEIPLNSPNSFESIKNIKFDCKDLESLGAGTVLNVKDVELASEAGCNFIFSPNCNTEVIKETKSRKLISIPGIMTPTEAFTALDAGADAIKLFPAHIVTQQGLKSILAVLPNKTKIYVVGGIETKDMVSWLVSGAFGFGIGSTLYKSGYNTDKIEQNAAEIIRQYDLGIKNLS